MKKLKFLFRGIPQAKLSAYKLLRIFCRLQPSYLDYLSLFPIQVRNGPIKYYRKN